MKVPARRSVLVVVAAAATALALSQASVAQAVDPPYAFDPATQMVFVAEGFNTNQTQWFTASQSGTGASLAAYHGPTNLYVNAIGFSVVDNYIYGMCVAGCNGTNHLVQIGLDAATAPTAVYQDDLGPVTGLPGSFNAGTMDDTGILYVRHATGDNMMYAIDVATLTYTPITLSRNVPNTADLFYLGGFVWTVNGTNGDIYRIDPASGTTDLFPAAITIQSDSYGAQWVYGNGNVGMLGNSAAGMLYQFSITNPTAAAPTFTIVAGFQNPTGTSQNDGTAIPGQPIDLSLAKTATPFIPGGTVTFTFTVKNNNTSGDSSGWVLTDPIPTGLVISGTLPAGCSITAAVLTCLGGPLAAGATAPVIAVTFTTPASQTTAITNVAHVAGNEADPNDTPTKDLTSNNWATVDAGPAAIIVDKSVTAPAVWAAGQDLAYTVVFTNAGPSALGSLVPTDSGITVANGDPSVGLGAYSTPVCTPEAVGDPLATPLASGESITCTYTYTLTQFDLDAMADPTNTVDGLTNTIDATGSDGVNQITGSDDASITPVLNDVIQPPVVVKNVDLTQAMAGNQLTYSYSVTNPDTNNISMHLIYQDVFDGSPMLTGHTCDLDPASTDVLVVGEPVAPEDIMTTLWLDDPWTAPTDGIGDGLSGAAVRLLPGQTVKCIFDPYTVTSTDAAAQSVNNKVTVYAYPLSTNEAMGPVTSAVKTLILTGGTVAPSGTTTVSITPAGPAAVLRKQGRLI